jgi:parvulin-like peptidyl-prolyl isomerase
MAGCGKKVLSTRTAAEDNRTMASADRGYKLAVRDFYANLQHSALMPTGGYLADSTVKWFLDSLLVDTLTGFEADELDLSRYYSNFWAYRTRLNTLHYYTFMQDRLSGMTVDSSAVADYYAANSKRYTVPEQVDISHILANVQGLLNGPDSLSLRILPQEQVEQLAHEYILMVQRKLDSGMTFAEAASLYSHDAAVKSNAGRLGWAGRGQFHMPFDSIAFQMTVGTYSAPYVDKDGWHLVYLHARRDAGTLPLTDSNVYKHAEQVLLTELVRARATGIMDSLSKDVNIVVNELLLDSNFYQTTDSLWFAIINDVDTVDVLTMRNAEDGLKRRLKVWNTTPEQKRQVIASLAKQYCVVQTARRERIDTIPAVRAKQAEMFHQEAKLVLSGQWFDKDWQPTDSMVKAYYDSHPKEFLVDKPLTVQQIVTKDSALAIFVRDQARAGVEFMDLAKEYYPGEEAIRVELADLGKIGPNDVDTNFYKAAYVMLPGEISEPVKTRYGFHIIKVMRHEDSRTLDDARVYIVDRLSKEYQMAGYNRLRDALYSKYHVKISTVPKSVFLEPLAYRKK